MATGDILVHIIKVSEISTLAWDRSRASHPKRLGCPVLLLRTVLPASPASYSVRAWPIRTVLVHRDPQEDRIPKC